MARNAKTPTPEALRAVIEPIAAAEGLFLEDVSISGPPNRLVVRVILDLNEDELGGLDLDRVATAARPISSALDDNDLFAGAYNLEVSSPGATRPLTLPRHFKRARTRMVKLTLTEGGPARGRIVAVDPGGVVLEGESGDRVTFGFDEIVRGVVEVELRRLDEAEFGPVDDDSQEEG